MSEDGSNGYDAIASIYIARRGTRPLVGDALGAATVRSWAQAFPAGATVLDLGCGPGEPSTRILREAGLMAFAVDASKAMVAAFRERFPGVPIEHNTAEASEFFGRTFDGVLAWGLLFLLEPAAQALVIEKVAAALNPGGRFLFTAPEEPLEWLDGMTDRRSYSLGAQAYDRLVRAAGLTWVAEAYDEGENHYFLVERRPPSRAGASPLSRATMQLRAAGGLPGRSAGARESPIPATGGATLDIPRLFSIAESAHRIHNPFTPEKLATLGAALRLEAGTRVLDLGSGSGEMLCTWARAYGITGTGIDLSHSFTEQAKRRAEELGVADRVEFIQGDATGYVSDRKAGVAACLGATWIAGGVVGTIELLAQSLLPGGTILIGEPYWRQLPPTEAVARGCLAGSISDFLLLPELLASFGRIGYDVVEMVLADQDSWDRYEAAKWLTMRRWLEANPDDELTKVVRDTLTSEPGRYAAYTRAYLGWGAFALMSR